MGNMPGYDEAPGLKLEVVPVYLQRGRGRIVVMLCMVDGRSLDGKRWQEDFDLPMSLISSVIYFFMYY